MVETSEWIWQPGHCQSVRPQEYVRLTHVQPDTAEPIVTYALDVNQPGHNPGEPVPVLVNGFTGEKESPPRRVPIAKGSAANPLGEEESLFTHPNGHKQIIWCPKRSGMVTRWRTVLQGTLAVDVEWLPEFAASGGLGWSLGAAEFTGEKLNTPGLAGNNINFGGAVDLPNDGAAPDVSYDVRCPVSPLLHRRITDTYVESAVAPMLFLDGENRAVAYGPHGMDETHSAWMWRHKQFQRVTPFVGGEEFVHLLTALFFAPQDWSLFGTEYAHLDAATLEQTSPLFLNGVALGIGGLEIMWGLGFDEGYFADVVNDDTPRNLHQFPDETVDYGAGNLQSWAFTDKVVTFNRGTGTISVGGQTPSRFTVVAHRRSSDGLTIGYCVKLGANSLLAELNPATALRVTQCSISGHGDAPINLTPTVPVPHHNHPGNRFLGAAINAFSRKAGWLGTNSLIYIGPLDQMITSLRRQKHLLVETPDPKLLIPASVRLGTDMADEDVRVAPPLERIRLTSALRTGARLR